MKNLVYNLAFLTVLAFGVAAPAVAEEAAGEGGSEGGGLDFTCPDSGFFSSKLLTNICWECLGPVNIGGVEWNFGPTGGDASGGYAEGQQRDEQTVPEGSSNNGERLCNCPDDLGVPQFGIRTSMREPSHMIELVRFPYCSPTMGGARISESLRGVGGSRNVGTNGAEEGAYYNVHLLRAPVMTMLDLYFEQACMDGYVEVDFLYISELNPIHNDPELALLVSPEVALYSNPVALAMCALTDAPLGLVGKTNRFLPWCGGTWGEIGLPGGFQAGTASPIQATSLIAGKTLYFSHRAGFLHDTMGEEAMCSKNVSLWIDKSQYALSTWFPVAEKSDIHMIGEHTFRWGEWRTKPGVGEDYVYMLWRYSDCCTLLNSSE